MSPIQLIDDAIVALGKAYANYSPREYAVRDAMFVLTITVPLLGAGAILLARDGWWKKDQRISFQTVAATWLVSILAFGVLVHLQHGVTTRTTFVVAVLHEQVEVLLDCVLLGFQKRKAFLYTWLFGVVLLFFVLVLPTMSQVFISAAIIGGGNDMLIALLFLHGKQWCFGFAGLAHVISAIAVFTQAIRNVGVVPFNAITFISLWAHVGFTVAGVLRHEERFNNYDGPFLNPLDGVQFKLKTLLKLGAIGVIGSTGITLFLAYVLPVL